MSQNRLKDSELQAHYDAMFDMFASPGWLALMEKTDLLIKMTDSLTNVANAEQLFFKKGVLDNLQWLKSQRTYHEMSYNQLVAVENDSDEDELTDGVAKVIA